MTTATAQKVVLTGALVTLTSSSGYAIAHVSPKDALSGPLGVFSGRQVGSTFLGFAALAIVAELAPEIGAGLAIAVSATAFVTMGLPALDKFGFTTKG